MYHYLRWTTYIWIATFLVTLGMSLREVWLQGFRNSLVYFVFPAIALLWIFIRSYRVKQLKKQWQAKQQSKKND